MACTLRLPRDLDDRLAAHCREHGATKAGVTRVALNRYLAAARVGREPEDSPFAGQRLGALRLVLSLADSGCDPEEIAAETGLDVRTIATAGIVARTPPDADPTGLEAALDDMLAETIDVLDPEEAA